MPVEDDLKRIEELVDLLFRRFVGETVEAPCTGQGMLPGTDDTPCLVIGHGELYLWWFDTEDDLPGQWTLSRPFEPEEGDEDEPAARLMSITGSGTYEAGFAPSVNAAAVLVASTWLDDRMTEHLEAINPEGEAEEAGEFADEDPDPFRAIG